MDRRRVLIVGGGIAVLALAPMLARPGVAVEVIERSPVPATDGTTSCDSSAGESSAPTTVRSSTSPEPTGPATLVRDLAGSAVDAHRDRWAPRDEGGEGRPGVGHGPLRRSPRALYGLVA
jgi:glycine/D-amino acid oxidase-like deaminating enzyme